VFAFIYSNGNLISDYLADDIIKSLLVLSKMRSFIVRRVVAVPSTSFMMTTTPMAFCSAAFASTKLYTKSHEWIEIDEASKTAVLGLSNYAIKQLNDITFGIPAEYTFIEFPAVGTGITQDAPICSIECLKADIVLTSPCAGEIAEINSFYEDSANLANLMDGGAENAEGWLFKVKNVSVDKSGLMSAEEFEKFCALNEQSSRADHHGEKVELRRWHEVHRSPDIGPNVRLKRILVLDISVSIVNFDHQLQHRTSCTKN
jgi:glycine cleavage system H lipoate-binding protein